MSAESPERRIPRRGLRGNGRSGMPRSPFFAAAPWALRGSGSGTRRSGSLEPPNSRLYHGAGRDLPGTRHALSPRKRFFSWTVHGPFSFCQDQTGPPQERKRSGSCGERRSKGAGVVFAARRKRSQADFATTTMGGGFPPAKPASHVPAPWRRENQRLFGKYEKKMTGAMVDKAGKIGYNTSAYDDEEDQYPSWRCKENPWHGEKGRAPGGEYTLESAPQRPLAQ